MEDAVLTSSYLIRAGRLEIKRNIKHEALIARI